MSAPTLSEAPCPCWGCKGPEQGYCGCAECRDNGVPLLCMRRCGAKAEAVPGLEADRGERLCAAHGAEWLAHLRALPQPWLSRYPRFLAWLEAVSPA